MRTTIVVTVIAAVVYAGTILGLLYLGVTRGRAVTLREGWREL